MNIQKLRNSQITNFDKKGWMQIYTWGGKHGSVILEQTTNSLALFDSQLLY